MRSFKIGGHCADDFVNAKIEIALANKNVESVLILLVVFIVFCFGV